MRKLLKRTAYGFGALLLFAFIVGMFAPEEEPVKEVASETATEPPVEESKDKTKPVVKKTPTKKESVPAEQEKKEQQEQKYVDEMTPLLDESSTLMYEMGGIYTAMSTDPSMFMDDAVHQLLADNLAGVKANYQKIVAVDPPIHIADTHGRLTEATYIIVEAVTLAYEGVIEMDIEKLTLAGEMQTLGNEQLNEVTLEFMEMSR